MAMRFLRSPSEMTGLSRSKFVTDPMLIAVTIVAVITGFYPFHAGAAKLKYFQDDFFYYLEIARNIAATGRSTFDGTTLTNGYHPLWLLVILGAWLAGKEQLVFIVVALLISAGTAACYLLTRSLCAISSLGSGSAVLLSAWTALFYLSIARTGMEVILTVPLMLAFLRCVCDGKYLEQPRRLVVGGLLASAVLLSRLDTVLFLAGFGFLLLLQQPNITRLKQAAWFLIGLSPFFLYLISNQLWFGDLWPASSQAKHLKHGFRPDGTALHSLFSPFGLVAMAFLIPAVLLLALGCISLVRKAARSWRTPRYAAFAIAILFPFLYFGLLSIVSDWRIWTWYRYPLVVSSVAAILVIRTEGTFETTDERRWTYLPAYVCTLLLCVAFLSGLRKTPQNTDIYHLALHLQQFARQHPGHYAMGDAAGTPAYLMDQPVTQLEGLVMDKRYLENIREQRPLLDVLKQYGVRYYISLDAVDQDGCSFAYEPLQAGPDSPHMTATICQKPVDDFSTGQYQLSIFDLDQKNSVVPVH